LETTSLLWDHHALGNSLTPAAPAPFPAGNSFNSGVYAASWREEKNRRKALSKLLPMQCKDFAGLFTSMDGLPVVIRVRPGADSLWWI
jgi:hypothetical protein